MYTVGLKRRFLPGFKKYWVRDHSTAGDSLVLVLADLTQIAIHGLAGRMIAVFPDYQDHARHVELAKVPVWVADMSQEQSNALSRREQLQ